MTERIRVAWIWMGESPPDGFPEPGRIYWMEKSGVVLLQLDNDGQCTGSGFTERQAIRIPEGPAAD